MRRFYNISAKNMRNSDWQSRGQRFDPAYLHQKKATALAVAFFVCGGPKGEKTGSSVTGGTGQLRNAAEPG